MATEIEILGHKVKIKRVRGQRIQYPLGIMAEKLAVWLEFDSPVGNVISFAVLIPVKKYEREEFLYNVCRCGEEELKCILERYEKEDKERQEGKERQKELDAMAAEAQSLIE